jgi:uncharacterized damage-inducible protein DinB
MNDPFTSRVPDILPEAATDCPSRTLQSLFDYTEWLMQRAAGACRNLPDGLFTAPTVFANGRNLGNGSLRETLLHMACIEQRWVGVRLLGQPFRPAKEQFPPQNYPDVDSIMQVWADGRLLTMRWLAGHADVLDTPRETLGIFGGPNFRSTPRELLLHALTHTIGHRSDLSSQFSFHGLDLPGLDYVIFVSHK